MTDFRFDDPPSPQTNRAADVTDCPSCQGNRLVPVEAFVDADGREFERYARCPQCNPAPVRVREPVAQDAWWKE